MKTKIWVGLFVQNMESRCAKRGPRTRPRTFKVCNPFYRIETVGFRKPVDMNFTGGETLFGRTGTLCGRGEQNYDSRDSSMRRWFQEQDTEEDDEYFKIGYRTP